ncbi:MAG: hypothetical protein AMXMBFR64_07640 [Myxococcales bacterium]
MSKPTHPVTARLAATSPALFAAWAVLAAFSTYFCMYAFRKPFAVGTFAGTVDLPLLPPMDYKVALIIAQVLGYCISKFIGIKVVSEMSPGRRAAAVLVVIGVAWAALLLFAITPAPWSVVFLFLNGIPLGMVWGLVFGFLEGRRVSDVLGAGLSASYIVASGAVKSVGKLLLDAGVPEAWMPFCVGAVFALPMAGFVWMLARLPPPSPEDEARRCVRAPMDGQARKSFLLRFAPSVLPLTLLYVLLTAYRDFRDNFSRELYDALGAGSSAGIFAVAEIPIALGVLVVLALLTLVQDNRKAVLVVHAVMGAGTALIGVATLLWSAGILGSVPWMIAVGLGLYIAYVPYGCVLFDRLLAAVGSVGTAAFLIYLTDAFGYLGSVLLLLVKTFWSPDLSWLDFFVAFSHVTAVACTALFAVSFVWLATWGRRERTAGAAQA